MRLPDVEQKAWGCECGYDLLFFCTNQCPECASLIGFEGKTLFCSQCDYNLSGTVTPRCPECGTSFNTVQILRIDDQVNRIISIRSTLVGLVWPALVYTICAILLIALGHVPILVVGGSLAFFVLIAVAVFSSGDMTRRWIFKTGFRGEGPFPRPARKLVVLLTTFFAVIQITLGLVGFIVAALFLRT